VREFQWSEEYIQHILQQMPMVRDERSKEEVYRQVSLARKKERMKMRLIPAVVSMAAVLLFVIIGLSIHSIPQPKQEKMAKNKKETVVSLRADEHAPENKTMIQPNKNERDVTPSRIVTKEDLRHQDVVVFGLPDVNAQTVIPVSILVQKDGQSREQQMEKAKAQLREEEWGLSKSLLDHVAISSSRENKGVWLVHVPKTHPVFSGGSTSEEMFLSSMEETVRWAGGKEVQFFTDNQKGIELPNTGRMELMKIADKKRAYYLYQFDRSHPLFLAPSRQLFQSLKAALQQMKNVSEQPFRPSIPKQVSIAMIHPQQDGVIIKFTNDSKLDASPSTHWMIEAILLTAKEFGFQSVTFMGGNVSRVGPYVFGKKIDVPIAPNPMPIK
jgi:hypothetical protein